MASERSKVYMGRLLGGELVMFECNSDRLLYEIEDGRSKVLAFNIFTGVVQQSGPGQMGFAETLFMPANPEKPMLLNVDPFCSIVSAENIPDAMYETYRQRFSRIQLATAGVNLNAR